MSKLYTEAVEAESKNEGERALDLYKQLLVSYPSYKDARERLHRLMKAPENGVRPSFDAHEGMSGRTEREEQAQHYPVVSE